MCSNCSGDYTGGFEDDSGEPESAAFFGSSSNFRGSAFQGDALSSGHDEANGADDGGVQMPAQAGAEWSDTVEIFVSATELVEIRTIAARPGAEDVLSARRDGSETQQDQHSRRSSAKYYASRTEMHSLQQARLRSDADARARTLRGSRSELAATWRQISDAFAHAWRTIRRKVS